MAVMLNLSRFTGGSIVSRIRGNATVVLAVSKTDAGSEVAGEFALSLLNGKGAVATFPLQHGSNVISFDVPVAPGHDPDADVGIEVLCDDATNVQVAWADLQVTQLECLVENAGEVALSPISLTPITVMGNSLGGSGGGWIQKAGDLSMVNTIEVTGFFTADAIALAGQTELYGPAWLAPEAHVALGAPVAIPVDEGGWGWVGGSCPVPGLPEGGAYLCEVTLDGGAPVLALLFNQEGF